MESLFRIVVSHEAGGRSRRVVRPTGADGVVLPYGRRGDGVPAHQARLFSISR